MGLGVLNMGLYEIQKGIIAERKSVAAIKALVSCVKGAGCIHFEVEYIKIWLKYTLMLAYVTKQVDK